MDKRVIVIVEPPETRVGPAESAIWHAYGQIHEQAVAHVGADMAFSIFFSRLTRELRREIGIEGAKQAFLEIVRTMDAAAENDRDG